MVLDLLQTYSKLASFSPIYCCLLLHLFEAIAVLFSHGNLASTPTLQCSGDSGRKVQVGGFGCLKHSLLGPEQAAGETAGGQAQQRLSESDKISLLLQWLPKQLLPL